MVNQTCSDPVKMRAAASPRQAMIKPDYLRPISGSEFPISDTESARTAT